MFDIFQDEIVQISDFKKRSTYWLDVVRNGTPVTVAQGSQADVIILRRSDAANHMKIIQYAKAFAQFMLEQTQGMDSQVLPWHEHLDPEEKREFSTELLRGFSEMVHSGKWEGFAYLLQDWQAMAEANLNPDLLTALEVPERPEEYIVVERPDAKT